MLDKLTDLSNRKMNSEMTNESLFYTRLLDLCDNERLLRSIVKDVRNVEKTFGNLILDMLKSCEIKKEWPMTEIPKRDETKVFDTEGVTEYYDIINQWRKYITTPRQQCNRQARVRVKKVMNRQIPKIEENINHRIDQRRRTVLTNELRDINIVCNGIIREYISTDKYECKYQADILKGQLRRIQGLIDLTISKLYIYCEE
jgi:hypothetical protein